MTIPSLLNYAQRHTGRLIALIRIPFCMISFYQFIMRRYYICSLLWREFFLLLNDWDLLYVSSCGFVKKGCFCMWRKLMLEVAVRQKRCVVGTLGSWQVFIFSSHKIYAFLRHCCTIHPLIKLFYLSSYNFNGVACATIFLKSFTLLPIFSLKKWRDVYL